MAKQVSVQRRERGILVCPCQKAKAKITNLHEVGMATIGLLQLRKQPIPPTMHVADEEDHLSGIRRGRDHVFPEQPP